MAFIEALIIGAIIGALAEVAIEVLRIFLLLLADVVEWFVQRLRHHLQDPNKVAFTLRECFQSGNYAVVQGVFDTQRNTVVGDARRIQAQQVDDRIRAAHERRQVVVYQ